MFVDPILTKEEFSTLHNGICDIDSVARQLEDVINPALYEKLARGLEAIRAGLKGAYEQDHQAFQRAHKLVEAAADANGFNAVWSLYEVTNFSDPHPYEGAVAVVYSEYWGERPVQALIEGNTWLDLYKAADIAIKRSGDRHHLFIEGFVQEGDLLRLVTGS